MTELLASPAAPRTAPKARRKKRQMGAWLALGWIALVVLSAAFADVLPLHPPNQIGNTFAAMPGWGSHPLGTDALGRDVLSRLVYGARVSMAVAIGASGISMVVGVTLGMLAGFLGGRVDAVISFVVNFLLAFPPLVFLIAMVTALEPSLKTLVIALATLGIPHFARVARANTLALAEREFVVASRALGATPWRTLRVEVLINVLLPVMSLTLLVMATLVVAEGGLSFLGVGVPPPTPTWGVMLEEGRTQLSQHPQLTLVPAAVFFLTVFAFNRLADWARSRVGRESSI